jgi:hypothetical protein
MSLSPKIVINDRFLNRQLNQDKAIPVATNSSSRNSSSKYSSANYVPVSTTDGISNNEAD